MGCGDSRVVPPSLPRRGDNPNEEAVCFEHHDDERGGNSSGTDKQPIDDDGGVDEYEGEFDFITENSQPDLVQQVIREFVPVKGDDLVILGTPCIRLLSAAQRTKLEESNILESLRNEGLIARPIKKSLHATGFEIIEDKPKPISRLAIPPPLREREDRPEKPNVTTEMISEKLAKAEERRKQQEEVRKARAQTSKPRPNKQQEQAEELRNQQMDKLENGIRSREMQLMEKKEKLHEKHLRIKGVNFKKSFKNCDPFDDE